MQNAGVTAGQMKLVMRGLKRAELAVIKQVYSQKLVVSTVARGYLYASFLPIVVKLNLTEVISKQLVSVITNKETFLKTVAYANKAEYKSLVQAFEKAALAENGAFRQLINSEPKTVDAFFEYYRKNPTATLDEVLARVGRVIKLVPELTENAIKHINKGEVKYVFKDVRFPGGRKEFNFETDKIWAQMESDFNMNGEFTQLIFDKSYNMPTIDFVGMHNYDNFINFTHSSSPTGKLFNSSGTDIIGEVAGKKAYSIKDPEVWIPDISNLVSKNKYKQVQNRVWDGAGNWQLKSKGPTGRLSSTFLENMSEQEINQMISEAFNRKIWDGTQWEGKILYKGNTITIRGYSEDGYITSAFIKLIE